MLGRCTSPSSKENTPPAALVYAAGISSPASGVSSRRKLPLGRHRPTNIRRAAAAAAAKKDLRKNPFAAAQQEDLGKCSSAATAQKEDLEKQLEAAASGKEEPSPGVKTHPAPSPPPTPEKEAPPLTPPAAQLSTSPDIFKKKGSREFPIAEGCFGIGPTVQGNVKDRRKSKPRALLTVEPLPNAATLVWDGDDNGQTIPELPKPGRASLEWISDDPESSDFTDTSSGSASLDSSRLCPGFRCWKPAATKAVVPDVTDLVTKLGDMKLLQEPRLPVPSPAPKLQKRRIITTSAAAASSPIKIVRKRIPRVINKECSNTNTISEVPPPTPVRTPKKSSECYSKRQCLKAAAAECKQQAGEIVRNNRVNLSQFIKASKEFKLDVPCNLNPSKKQQLLQQRSARPA